MMATTTTTMATTTTNSVQFQMDKAPDKALERQFKRTIRALHDLPKNSDVVMTSEDKLEMYALYMQATQGPCNRSKPSGLLDLVAISKWQAWKRLKDMSRGDAMAAYVGRTRQVAERHPKSADAAHILQSIDGVSVVRPDRSKSVPDSSSAKADSSSSKTDSSFTKTDSGSKKTDTAPERPQSALRTLPANLQPTSPTSSFSSLPSATTLPSPDAATTPSPAVGSPPVEISAPASRDVSQDQHGVIALDSMGDVAQAEHSKVIDEQMRLLESSVQQMEAAVDEQKQLEKELAPTPEALASTLLTLAGNVSAAAIGFSAAYVVGGWLRLYRR